MSKSSLISLKIAAISFGMATAFVVLKFVIHAWGWEPIEQSSLHNAAISSVIFVIGFLLSATIADYKESERIPSEMTANLEDMYDDGAAIHQKYPVFDLKGYRRCLRAIAADFGHDARRLSGETRDTIRDLSQYFYDMEAGQVPPNFIVKLKQQQTSLLRMRQRVTYIQRIRFIPSAVVLARTIVALVLVLLMLTNVDPFYGSLAIVGIISYVLVYMLFLIDVISTPFHDEGKTRDDVSLFQLEETIAYLSDKSSKGSGRR